MARDLTYTRNIGIMAHIDAGKTTTSEFFSTRVKRTRSAKRTKVLP